METMQNLDILAKLISFKSKIWHGNIPLQDGQRLTWIMLEDLNLKELDLSSVVI